MTTDTQESYDPSALAKSQVLDIGDEPITPSNDDGGSGDAGSKIKPEAKPNDESFDKSKFIEDFVTGNDDAEDKEKKALADDADKADESPEVIEDPPNLSEKQNGWAKKMRLRTAGVEKRAKELQERVNAYESKQQDDGEVEKLRARVKELDDEMQRTDYSKSDAFKSTYLEPRQEQIDDINQMINAFKLDGKAINHASALGLAERNQLLSRVIPDEGIRSDISHELRALDKLTLKSNSAIKAWKEEAPLVEGKYKERMMNQRMGMMDDVVTKLSSSDFLYAHTANDAWNADRATRIKYAKDLSLKAEDPKQLARICADAAQVNDYKILYAEAVKESMKLRNDMKRMKGSMPSSGGGSSKSSSTPSSADGKGYDPSVLAAMQMNKL